MAQKKTPETSKTASKINEQVEDENSVEKRPE